MVEVAATAVAKGGRRKRDAPEVVSHFDLVALAFSGKLEGGKFESVPTKLRGDKKALAAVILAKWPAGGEAIA